MLKIVQAPEAVLSQKAAPIKKIDQSVHDLIAQMTETLENTRDPEGVGLAAPQVGKSVQLFIIKETPKSPVKVFINPELHIPHPEIVINELEEQQHKVPDRKKDLPAGRREKEKDVQLEGCLSIKDIWGVVKRHAEVELTYLDEKGAKHTDTFKEFFAVIVQHEWDHLQGTLFPKRVLEQKQKLYKAIKDEDDETVFEEITI